ncbi:MAG TPA: hypothetical protein VMB50_00250 [Myxococcales bacterium]|nr:hypothetical protein [Myxococcales bacterium]
MRAVLWSGVLLAALAGCAEAPPIPPPDAAPAVREGHDLYLAKCTLCHDAIPPSEHARSEWPGLVARYAPRARLSPEDRARVLAYVEQYAR